MSLTPGTRLGPYEIQAAIGAGGMGEVYRARDTRLDRTVAIKVISAPLAADPQLRERFEREARAISSLNHPHICALFDVGEAASGHFLVLEYLEGETLAQKLAAGPLKPADAMTYAIQIADALDKAHRAGIVHRDLKPANVMITKTGAKLLDFGLAKSAAPIVAASGVSMLPTTPPAMTAQGTILGTFEYMAPEQIEGLEADARTDIFAFGALLFEMLTGRKTFAGKTRASLLGSILKDEPAPVSSLAPAAPPALDRVIATCLAKDPDDRYQSARDLVRDLKWATSDSAPASAVAPPRRAPTPPWVWFAAAAAVTTLIASSVIAVRHLLETPAEERVIQFAVPPPEDQTFAAPVGAGTGQAVQFAISPDGRQLAFVATGPHGSQIWVRALDSLSARPLPGTTSGTFPFWSPDSRWLAFFADGKLKKVQLAGGPAIALCDVRAGRGGTWNADNVIIFGPSTVGPLQRVSASGGVPADISTLDKEYGETNHRFPHFLPDGRYYLFTAVTGAFGAAPKPSRIKVGSLDSSETVTLLEVESMAQYASGHLLLSREGTLLAQSFDLTTRQFNGEPFPVAEQLAGEGSRYASFSLAGNGTLVYAHGAMTGTQLTWFDRAGKTLGTLGEPGFITNVVLSPDEKRVALTLTTGPPPNRDVWIMDVARGTMTRVTFGAGEEAFPVWSPDGARLVFRSMRAGDPGMRVTVAGGTAADEPLLKAAYGTGIQMPVDWSRDGRYISYVHDTNGNYDIWVLPTDGDRKPFPLVTTPFTEDSPVFSPDGRWVAYTSNESGDSQVYVQPFPPTGRKYLVSRGGGGQPMWRDDGRELYFLSPADSVLHAVDVSTGAQFEAGTPRRLFSARGTAPLSGRRQYSVTKDGQRFLFATLQAPSVSTPLTVVTNWRALGGRN